MFTYCKNERFSLNGSNIGRYVGLTKSSQKAIFIIKIEEIKVNVI